MVTNVSVRTHNTIVIHNLAVLYNLGANKEDVQMFFNDLMHLTTIETFNLGIKLQLDNLSLIKSLIHIYENIDEQ